MLTVTKQLPGGAIPRSQWHLCRVIQPAGVPRPVLFYDATPVAEHLARITRGWDMPEVALDAPIDPCITVIGTSEGYTIKSDWLDEPLAGLGGVAAVCTTVVDMALAWMDADRSTIALHCGAVELDGRLVILTGAQRAGKSTLTARLSAEDVRVYCDDMLPMPHDSLVGIALGIAPRPRFPLPDAASAAFRDHVARHAVAEDGHYCYVMSPNVAPHGTAAPIGTILLLDRRSEGPARLRAAGRAETVRALLLQNLMEDRDPAAVYERMHALTDRCAIYWLEYADLEDAVALILSSFRAEGRIPEPLPPHPDRTFVSDHAPETAAAPIPGTKQFRARPDISARELDGEVFLCDPAERAVLHLNLVGSAVWTLLGEGISADEAADLIAEAFPAAERGAVATDVIRPA
jgi:hypothetical protein